MGKSFWVMQELDVIRVRVTEIDLWQILLPLGASLTTLIGAAWRFRIPFLMLPIGILFALMVTLASNWGVENGPLRVALGLSGVTMLLVALRFDLKDPHRVRRSSDFAFWCYVVGSPLTIHPLFFTYLVNADLKASDGIPIALGLIVLSACISIVSLLINRRALILSTLIYLGFSVAYIASKVAGKETAALTAMLLIGLYVVCWVPLGVQYARNSCND